MYRFPLLLLVATFTALAAADATIAGVKDPGVEARKKIIEERILQHFSLGTTAPIEWFVETRERNGCRWDFRQGYFSGGAQDGWDQVFLNPWNKWENPDKVPGTWGEKFIKASIAEGFIPWVTMYNLAQSAPANYKPGPSQATPVNAKVNGTMRAYWEQVKVLMQICDRSKPFPVVVHVEPDEWGHLLLGGANGSKNLDPFAVEVKVGGSGHPDLSGLSDDLKGYSDAWLRLRALYAPYNVILVTNPSAWDWQGSMSGENWVRIFKAAGVDRWDFSVLEFGDRDIGCIPGKGAVPPYKDGEVVTRFQNWDAQMRWVKTLYEGTGLRTFFWQVAVGNTYYRSVNQTKGHFADGIAESILEGYPKNPMIARYVASGCAGFIFSPGQGHQTHVYDHEKDGITNPEPISGNRGLMAEYADDDGGYLRTRAAAYYQEPFPILGKPVAKKAKEAATKRERPQKPKVVTQADAAARESFLTRLRERASEAAGEARKPRFVYSAFGGEVVLLSVGETTCEIQVSGMNSTMTAPVFARLGDADARNLAVAVLRQGTASDHAVAAFFCRAANDLAGYREHLGRSGDEAATVEAAFPGE